MLASLVRDRIGCLNYFNRLMCVTLVGMTTDTDDKVTHVNEPATVPAQPGRFRRWRDRRAVARAGRVRDTMPPNDAPTVDRPTRSPLDATDWSRWYPALMWFAAGVVAVTFVLSYHGLYEFSVDVAHLPPTLAVIVPVGVDVFSLCCLAATFLLRDAPWLTRLYSWLMFGSTVAVSVAGNAVYAVSDVERRGAQAWGYLQYAAVVGAALWPAFSAGALHLLIVVRRNMERQRDTDRRAVATARAQHDAEERQQARALVLAAGGAPVSDILIDLGLDESRRRAVERWTKPIRDALAAPRPAVAAKSLRRGVTARAGE